MFDKMVFDPSLMDPKGSKIAKVMCYLKIVNLQCIFSGLIDISCYVKDIHEQTENDKQDLVLVSFNFGEPTHFVNKFSQ